MVFQKENRTYPGVFLLFLYEARLVIAWGAWDGMGLDGCRGRFTFVAGSIGLIWGKIPRRDSTIGLLLCRWGLTRWFTRFGSALEPDGVSACTDGSARY